MNTTMKSDHALRRRSSKAVPRRATLESGSGLQQDTKEMGSRPKATKNNIFFMVSGAAVLCSGILGASLGLAEQNNNASPSSVLTGSVAGSGAVVSTDPEDDGAVHFSSSEAGDQGDGDRNLEVVLHHGPGRADGGIVAGGTHEEIAEALDFSSSEAVEHEQGGDGDRNLAVLHGKVLSGSNPNGAEGYHSVIAGGTINTIGDDESSMIGAGYKNTVFAPQAFLGAGWGSIIRQAGENSFIGGGKQHNMYGDKCAIAGGISNYVSSSADKSFVGSGSKSLVQADYAGIVAGENNFAHLRETAMGSLAHGHLNFVGAGAQNELMGQHEGIVAGMKNRVLCSHDFIGAGYDNFITNYVDDNVEVQGGFIAAGQSNFAVGENTVVLGAYNEAWGNNTVVIGYNGYAEKFAVNSATLTFQETDEAECSNTTDYSVNVCATNGLFVEGRHVTDEITQNKEALALLMSTNSFMEMTGKGYCEDLSGKYYDAARSNTGTSWDAEDCAKEAAYWNLPGFELGQDSTNGDTFCVLLFEKDDPNFASITQTTHFSKLRNVGPSAGSGQVSGSDRGYGSGTYSQPDLFTCYKNIHLNSLLSVENKALRETLAAMEKRLVKLEAAR